MNLINLIIKMFIIYILGLNFLVLSNSGVKRQLAYFPETPSGESPTKETIIVPFASGTTGVQTSQSYSGLIGVSVSGVGQASGTEWSDAFYVFTNSEGELVEPHHPQELFNFTLWIDHAPADNIIQSIPPYNDTHEYTFFFEASGNPIHFGVGDVFTIDNTGNYTITVSQAFQYFMPVVEN
jgi:hypothetical protein